MPNAGAFKKGEKRPGQGRPKGVTNKVTANVKDCILQAFHKAGGVDYLVEQSQKNPVAFMSLVGKVVPTEIVADVVQTQYVVYALPEAVTAEQWQTERALQ